MSTNHTEHYNLSQWERTDKVLMDDFNADNAKIDAALKAEADARAAGDAAIQSSLSSQSWTVSRKGNCQLYTGSYVGNGRAGKENPMTLSFPRKPYLVIVSGGERARHLIMLRGLATCTAEVSGEGYTSYLTWSGSSVSWWCNGNSAPYMMTENGVTYQVVALLKADD